MRHATGRAMRAISVAAALAALGALSAPAPVYAAWEATLVVSFSNADGAGIVTSDGGGIECGWTWAGQVGDCSETFILPTFQSSFDVTLTYDPGGGSYACLGPSVGCSPGGSTLTSTIQFQRDGPSTLTANPQFWLKSYQVGVDLNGPGTVIGTGTSCPAGSGFSFCQLAKHGTTIALTALPESGYPFNFWEGPECATADETCSFVVTEPVALVAYFGRYAVTIHGSPGGTLCLDGRDPCARDDEKFSWNLQKGVTVKAIAKPRSGWAFDHWSSGPCAGRPASCTFVLSGPTDLTATFRKLATATPAPTPKPTSKPTPRPTPTPAGSTPPASAAPGASTAAPASPPAPTVAISDPASIETLEPPTATDSPAATEGASPAESDSTVPDGAAATSSLEGPLLLGVGLIALVALFLLGFLAGRRRVANGRASRIA